MWEITMAALQHVKGESIELCLTTAKGSTVAAVAEAIRQLKLFQRNLETSGDLFDHLELHLSIGKLMKLTKPTTESEARYELSQLNGETHKIPHSIPPLPCEPF